MCVCVCVPSIIYSWDADRPPAVRTVLYGERKGGRGVRRTKNILMKLP